MRDDEGDESNCARASRADSVTENPLENERDDDCAPADENRGRIKIGDRRSFLEIHARDEAEGVDGEREEEEIEGGSIQRAIPNEPGKAGEEKSEHVEVHAVGERIDVVEEELVRGALYRGGLFLREPVAQKCRALIESRRVVVAIRVTERGVGNDDRMNFAAAERFSQSCAD